MSNPFSKFTIAVPAFNDTTIAPALVVLVNKLATFAGDPSYDQNAEAAAMSLVEVIGKLSQLGV